MNKSTDYENLFDRYGDHQTALAMRHIANVWMPDCPYLRRNQRKMLIDTRNKVIGRAYRVYSQIRKLNGY